MQRLQFLQNQLASNHLSNFVKTELKFEDNGKIGIIYLNSPKDLNALSKQMRTELIQHLDSLDKDPKVKAIVMLSKVDKAFCAGADITEFTALTYEDQIFRDIFQEIENRLSTLAKPLIIGVNGFALGGGCEIALSADILVCSEDAKFGLPEIKLGLIPGIGGTQRLTKIVGKNKASRYILTGDFFNAKEAAQMNMVSDIFKKESLHEETIKLATRVSDKSRTTLMIAKKAIRHAEELPISQGLKFERSVFMTLFNTQGCKEGVDAFIKKRKYDFKDF